MAIIQVHCRKEEKTRKPKPIVLFPIRLDDAAKRRRKQGGVGPPDRNVGDFTRWKDHDAYERSFERVLRDLTKPQPTKIP